VPKQNIGTLHSFAYRALGNPPIADTPKMLVDWNEWVTEQGHPYYRISQEGGDLDDLATEAGQCETNGDRAYQEYCIGRARCIPVGEMTPATQGFVQFWEDFKSETGSVDFAEMIERAYADVEKAPGDPQVILADEAQDFNLANARLMSKWARHTEHFVQVGDGLQCLYYWCGSDPEAFTQTPLPPEAQEVLARSYRVPRKVHALAERWIAPLKAEEEKRLGIKIDYHPRFEIVGKDEYGKDVYGGQEAEGEVRALLSATWKQPQMAIKEAERYLDQGKTVLFVAACSHMLQPTINALRKAGLPFMNPWRSSRGDWNPLTPGRGMSAAQRLLFYLRLDERAWPDPRLWNAKELHAWIELVEAKGLLKRGAKEGIKQAADKPLPVDADGVPQSGELTLATLADWFEDINTVVDIADATASGDALAWLEKRLLSTKKKALEFPAAVLEKRGPQALREKPRIFVGTIHSCKGGEADVTIFFPDLSSAGYANYLTVGPERDGILRAGYVALTRAKETLILCQRATPAAIQYPSVSDLLT
jgi:DNA helicase-2/ATP-dependent DNA helicase PcrA